MQSQLGLVSLWNQGDWITRGVVLLLLSMSLASWTVIVLKSFDIFRFGRLARLAEPFWHSRDIAEGMERLGPDPQNPFRLLVEAVRESAAHHRATKAQLQDSLDLSDWLTRSLRNSIDDATSRLQSGMAILASVGSTAPFVGLFGTVWGIYHALMGIGAAGQATIDQVAGPIGEALIMTALGLAVAIPAVLGYNALVRGNKSIIFRLNRFGHDLHAHFLTGARVGSDGVANVVPMKKT